MAAEVVSFSGLNPTFSKLPNKPSSPIFQSHYLYTPKKNTQHFRISANLGGGGGGGGGGEAKKGEKKKFITREEEPQQYWQSAGERAGENPMKTPLPYIIIFGMSTPFVILAIAFANGWIKGSKTLLALLVPMLAVFASAHGAFLASITLILMSTTFLLIFCKQKPIMLIEESQISKIDFSPQEKQQENTLIRPADSLCDVDLVPVPALEAEADMKREDGKDQFLIASQDLYSESDQFSTSSSSEDHSSDIEWPYNLGQRLECSDDSISDEESLIEIAIPTGQFVKDFKCCKLSHQESIFQKDFWADVNEMNEEDNLIEIDIYMGSIKCTSFDI